MKKVKLAFWIIILILFGLLIYQNQPYFLTEHSLELDLYFTAGRTVPVFNLIIVVAFFGFGLLIAYTSSLFERFKANKTIKELRGNEHTLQTTIDQMRTDVETLKASAPTGEVPPVPDGTPNDTTEPENTLEPQAKS
jgi:Ni/Fe-hydrogenase subunit HybB-like protein